MYALPDPVSPLRRALAVLLVFLTFGIASLSCDGDDDWTPNDKGFSGNPGWKK